MKRILRKRISRRIWGTWGRLLQRLHLRPKPEVRASVVMTATQIEMNRRLLEDARAGLSLNRFCEEQKMPEAAGKTISFTRHQNVHFSEEQS